MGQDPHALGKSGVEADTGQLCWKSVTNPTHGSVMSNLLRHNPHTNLVPDVGSLCHHQILAISGQKRRVSPYVHTNCIQIPGNYAWTSAQLCAQAFTKGLATIAQIN